MSETVPETVVVGLIGAAHGIRGEVRVKSFTEPAGAIADYGPLTVVGGKGLPPTLTVQGLRDAGTMLVVKFKEIGDRNAAERLNGRELVVERSVLPEADGEDDFYYADLIGLDVVDETGQRRGRVVAVENFGASDLLEIAPPEGPTVYLAFTKEFVTDVDLDQHRVTIVVPEGLFDRPDPARKRTRHPPRDGGDGEGEAESGE
jgi:16S rRNA processing protein RimM